MIRAGCISGFGGVMAFGLISSIGIGQKAQGAAFLAESPLGGLSTNANIVNEPNNTWSWNTDAPITYKFDQNFLNAFPDTRIHDQVRLALQTWQQAAVTANGTTSRTFSFFRDNGLQPFGDIRTIALHEIGHVLGFDHPDEAEGMGNNFRPDDSGVWRPASALEAPDGRGTGNEFEVELMHSSFEAGQYNHVLSNDELDAFRFAYDGRNNNSFSNLRFQEVEMGEDADITLGTFLGFGSSWALAPPDGQARVPTDRSQGGRIDTAQILFNQNSTSPMGFQTLALNWDVINSRSDTVKLEVQTTGTNNQEPLFRFDNTNTARAFTLAKNDTLGPDFKDDLLHRWEDPIGGVIPSGDVMHVGLEQDVWDWEVVAAQATAPDGRQHDVPLMTIHNWSQSVVREDRSGSSPDQGLVSRLNSEAVARGIQIIAPAGTAEVFDLWVAPAGGLNLGLDDLNRQTFNQFFDDGSLIRVTEFADITLGRSLLPPDPTDPPPPCDPLTVPFCPIDPIDPVDPTEGLFEDFIIILDGELSDLPEELREQGNFVFASLPAGVLDDELFVAISSFSGDSLVTSYALLNTAPVVTDPVVKKADFNQDGLISGLDINGFIVALTDPEQFTTATGLDPALVGDLNGDAVLSGLDISPFVDLLIGTGAAGIDASLKDQIRSLTVPEPTSAVAMGWGVAVFFGCSRRWYAA